MEAGSGKRIMRLVYDGRAREVEPYALSYKRPKSGPPSEYFYVWDLTGGEKTPPGLRSLFHHKIGKLELTEKTFDPRYPIELSKAGEMAKNEHFGKPFSAKTPRVRRRRTPQAAPRAFRAFGGISYMLECPYCQKRFKRSTMTAALNPHKQDNGLPCHGRTGYFV